LYANADKTNTSLATKGNYVLAGPSTLWSPTVPSLEDTAQGKWLWTKHVREYDSGKADIWYNVTKDGEDGRGIEDINYEYALSDDGINHPTSGWSSDVP
jgi:hypothetical protein